LNVKLKSDLLLRKEILDQIKVAVKQRFDAVDAIIFDAALTLNELETKHKQRDYVS